MTSNWALILGASSGFGQAAALELARGGMNIAGVHMDRRETMARVEELRARLRSLGREERFFNSNAADDERRSEIVKALAGSIAPGGLRVLMHSLAFGVLKPMAEVARRQLENTCDAMGHSLVYWVRDLVAAGLLGEGGRVFAMTSAGGRRALPMYGPVSAAKAVLEAHVRQLAVEFAPRGITVNAIEAGVTETPALRAIPGHEKLAEFARARNPNGRLTCPEDVARSIAALAQPGTYWMTGNVIRVDGGEGTV
ncbi:MAG: SDR family oxidoreductase [Bryobacteraceae bacterium]